MIKQNDKNAAMTSIEEIIRSGKYSAEDLTSMINRVDANMKKEEEDKKKAIEAKEKAKKEKAVKTARLAFINAAKAYLEAIGLDLNEEDCNEMAKSFEDFFERFETFINETDKFNFVKLSPEARLFFDLFD